MNIIAGKRRKESDKVVQGSYRGSGDPSGKFLVIPSVMVVYQIRAADGGFNG